VTTSPPSGHGNDPDAPIPALTATADTVPELASAAPPALPSFQTVYREYFGFAWRTAAALGVPASALDDVTQEIFLIVHQRLPTFELRSSLKTWISGIVLNVVRHRRRSTLRKSPHELDRREPPALDAIQSPLEDPHTAAERAEGSALLRRLLAELDDERREVLVLAELEQLSVPEIAGTLGIKINTAYSRLRLARADFDDALRRHRARRSWRQP
jgi:RNA polymerase sigma-70 factor (ECF subfamily)